MNPTTSRRAVNYRTGELDLLSVLEVVLQQQPRVLKGGQPNLAFLRAANEALIEPDDEGADGGFVQVEFWLALARQARLLKVEDGRLGASAEADELFALPADKRRAALQRAWLEADDLNEFALTPELELPGLRKTRTVDVVSDVPSDMRPGRRAVARAAGALKAEMPLGRFIAQINEQSRDLFIDHGDDASWRHVYYRGIRERGAATDVERADNWPRVEGAVVKLIAQLILPRLGFVDFDPARGVIEPPAEPAPAPPAEIVVQPNFEVVALGEPGDISALWKLARISEPAPGRRVRKYVLERGRFADALARAASPDELIDFLASLSRTPLPQNVRYALTDWGQSTESIRIWPDALLIEAEGVEDLAATLPRALAERFDLRPLAGGHRACPMPDPAQVRSLLPPRKTLFDYSRVLPRVIHPGAGLTLNAPSETLHFRARRLLELLAVRESADRFTLDPSRVTQAAQSLSAQVVMRQFDEALAEDAPSQLNLALRSWTGAFGNVYAGPAEVLLCENLDQARALAMLPEFSAWVERSLSPTSYLLKAGCAEKAAAFLARLGVKPRRSAK